MDIFLSHILDKNINLLHILIFFKSNFLKINLKVKLYITCILFYFKTNLFEIQKNSYNDFCLFTFIYEKQIHAITMINIIIKM